MVHYSTISGPSFFKWSSLFLLLLVSSSVTQATTDIGFMYDNDTDCTTSNDNSVSINTLYLDCHEDEGITGCQGGEEATIYGTCTYMAENALFWSVFSHTNL